MKRKIVSRKRYRTQPHPDRAGDSVQVSLQGVPGTGHVCHCQQRYEAGQDVWTRTQSDQWIECQIVEFVASQGEWLLVSSSHGYAISRHQSEIFIEPTAD